MILEKSDANTLLVGSEETINRVPNTGLKAALAKIPESFASRLVFMTPEHHLVRNFAVRELPHENGRPIKVDRLAATLGLPIARVHAIVEDLERHLFFLVRNEAGEISWAFPVTTEPHSSSLEVQHWRTRPWRLSRRCFRYALRARAPQGRKAFR
jgi:hypothetical protein